MSSNWCYPLDALAASGVIDFDAPAFILDQPARYAGSPRYEEITDLLPPGTKMKDQPKSDGFGDDKNIVKNPSWKKWAAGALAIGVGAAAVLTVLIKKGKVSPAKMTTAINFIKDSASTVFDYIKKPFIWIAGKFKKKP